MRTKVFLSYSHVDLVWKDRLEQRLSAGLHDGMLSTWSDQDIEPGSDWDREIRAAISDATIVLLLVSERLLQSRYVTQTEIPLMLRARETGDLRVVPVLVDDVKLPPPLDALQRFPRAASLSGSSDADWSKVLDDVATWVFQHGPKVSVSHLPPPAGVVFGRDEQMEALEAAWNGGSRIAVVRALGGAGKTTLVNAWLARLANDGFRGANRVFGWSFYRQAAEVDRQISADLFLESALKWFDDPEPYQGSAWERGVRLANHVRRTRTLLVLDGLEPLQHPAGEWEGRVRDPALAAMFRELAAHNPGLCVISTRVAIADLAGDRVLRLDLEPLPLEASVELLRELGVEGAKEELEAAANEYRRHALALSLLGRFLHIAHGDDVRRRDRIPRLIDERREGAHARRVMQAYRDHYAGRAELDLLRMLSLFDRPAPIEALGKLCALAPVRDLVERSHGPGSDVWAYSVHGLRSAGLVDVGRAGASALECHPLVREYFAEEVRRNERSWRLGHETLFAHYSRGPEHPSTIAGLDPLYAAVSHGCAAGRHAEALRLFQDRIQRGGENFAVSKLGAIANELSCLRSFFERPWRDPSPELSASSRSLVLDEAGSRLFDSGRVEEAVEPLHAGLEADLRANSFGNAGPAARNLCEVLLALGRIPDAIRTGELGVELARRSGDDFVAIVTRVTLAASVLAAGDADRADRLFRDAEEIQRRLEPQFDRLYGLQGYLYCDHLLARGAHDEVLARAQQLFRWQSSADSILTIALDHLARGRALLGLGSHDAALRDVSESVVQLRRSRLQQYLPLGLLALAEVHLARGELERADGQIDDVFGLANHAGLQLFLIDAGILSVRLGLQLGQVDDARDLLSSVEELAGDLGYLRRAPELSELHRLAGQPPSASRGS